jgi:heme exporter protein C
MIFKYAVKPESIYKFCVSSKAIFLFFGVMFIVIAMYLGLFYVPADYQQKDAFRIIYVHVPAAFYSMGIFLSIGLLSAIFLIWRINMAEKIAYCLAPIGATMAFVALVTGSIWGKPMWGTWWIWDARLTSELVLFLLYCAYIGLYNSFTNLKVAQKVCSVLAVVGLIDLPIIHFSVNWWFTLHQGSTFVSMSGSKIDPSMLMPFFAMMLGLLLFITGLVCTTLSCIIVQRGQGKKWINELESELSCKIT